jgi:hypothetical protein
MIESPSIIENLSLSSGHDCEFCHPLTLAPFSGITVTNYLLIRGCHLVAHQGSGFVVRGWLIMEACTIETLYYCVYEDKGARVCDWVCGDTLFAMNENEAVGVWSEGGADALSKRLKKREGICLTREDRGMIGIEKIYSPFLNA